MSCARARSRSVKHERALALLSLNHDLSSAIDVEAVLYGLAGELAAAEVEPAVLKVLGVPKVLKVFQACYQVVVLTFLQEVDVVHEEAVAWGVNAAVLRVFPLEGVHACLDGEDVAAPYIAERTVAELLFAVDVEDALVPATARAFAHALRHEVDIAVCVEEVHRRDCGRGVSHALVAAPHAEASAFGILACDVPRIVAFRDEGNLVQLACLEVGQRFLSGHVVGVEFMGGVVELCPFAVDQGIVGAGVGHSPKES